MNTVTKKISLDLCGIGGNAFCLLGSFRRQAKKEGWTLDEIDEVLAEASRGDYDHLVSTLDDHCECDDDE